ncbi:zinc finger CCHC domain-containing protein 8 homolog [Anopheles nili]|uniref:zinc finger CCHC domain-containing protein 8 homolog n=1 Tax=Anopheles nili TaxID=185578 RepID=UPI00237BA0E7|nr:zinc finger CCHC domain-containing protein 8 homolog [Anopheles nili]
MDDSDVEIVNASIPVICVDNDISLSANPPDNQQPLVKVLFRSCEFYHLLQKAISDALKVVLKDHLPSYTVNINAGSDGCSLEVSETSETETLFVVDSTPNKSKNNKTPIPSYKKAMTKVFDGQTPPTNPDSLAKRPRSKQTCWNCEGDHGLKDCKEPRNYTRIRQKKEEFQKKTDRYHVDLEQKYGHLLPGKLSRELRSALGLGSRDLPQHIYRMRIFGYPPGWLEEAKITHSGLHLFGSNGDAVQDSGESDGEVDSVRCKYDVRKIIEYPGFNEPPPPEMFDDSKFYNTPAYSEEMSRESMIQQLEGTLVGGYRRKRLKLADDSGQCIDGSANTETVDMDHCPEEPETAEQQELEDGELSSDNDANHAKAPAIIDNSVILVETPVEVISLDDTPLVIQDTNVPSPSLADLQEKQKQLMEQLDEGPTAAADCSFMKDTAAADCSFMKDILLAEKLSKEAELSESVSSPAPAGHPCPPISMVPDRWEPLPPPPPPPEIPPIPPYLPCVGENTTLERPPEPETADLNEIAMLKVPYNDEPTLTGLKRTSLGTPILTAFTPYGALPSGEAFSKGVSDVIHFENLPNSTGKYIQMRSLLTKVRKKMDAHLCEMEDGS